MPGTTASIESEADQVCAPERQDRLGSQKSSRKHALPTQRWLPPSVSRASAFQKWVRRRLRTVIDKTLVLVRAGKAAARGARRLQHFARAKSDRQTDGRVLRENQRDEQCSSGLRKIATGGRKDAL